MPHLCGAEVEVHAVVLARHMADVKVAEAVDLKLEGQRWLQVTVDRVLLKLW